MRSQAHSVNSGERTFVTSPVFSILRLWEVTTSMLPRVGTVKLHANAGGVDQLAGGHSTMLLVARDVHTELCPSSPAAASGRSTCRRHDA